MEYLTLISVLIASVVVPSLLLVIPMIIGGYRREIAAQFKKVFKNKGKLIR